MGRPCGAHRARACRRNAKRPRGKAISTITLSEVPSPHPFGILLLDGNGHVEDWIEPSEESKKALALDHDVVPTGKDLINAGFYVFEPEFIERIPAGVIFVIGDQ